MSHHHRRAAAISAPDPYFSNTVLLLTGNGTNGGQNNTFLDDSSNNFSITRNGNTTQGSFSPFGYNWSNYFDGTGDYLNFTGITLTGDFCCECWYYRTANSTNYSVIFGGSSNAGTNNNQFTVTNTGGLTLVLSATVIISSAGTAFINNTWNHIAYVRNGTNCAVFVNGVRQGTGTSSIATSVCSRIGDIAGLAGYQPIGNISNARIVSGSSVYDPTQTTLTVPTAPLTAITNTSLLTCQSNRFVDNSSNAFTITRNGDVTVSNFSPFPAGEYAASVEGGSGYFDGTGDYLSAPSNSAFDFGTGDFTIECWAYFTALPQYSPIITRWSPTQWYLAVWSSTSIRYYAGNSVLIINASYTFSTGQWYHIALVRNSGTAYIYVNGSQVGSAADSNNHSSGTSTVTIGANTGFLSQVMQGYLSSVRVTKSAVYTANFTPSATPLTAITNTQLLLNFTNGSIVDATGKNDLETVGNAQVSTAVKKYGTGSMAFDGTGDYLFWNGGNLFAFGTGDFTIEFWLNINNTTGIQAIYDGRPQATNGAQPIVFLSSGSIRYQHSGVLRITGATLSTGQWYHIALCRSGTNTKLFIDGAQTGSTYSGDTTNYVNGANRPAIGADAGTSFTNGLNGYLDDFRVSKVARYTANFTPPYRQLPTR